MREGVLRHGRAAYPAGDGGGACSVGWRVSRRRSCSCSARSSGSGPRRFIPGRSTPPPPPSPRPPTSRWTRGRWRSTWAKRSVSRPFPIRTPPTSTPRRFAGCTGSSRRPTRSSTRRSSASSSANSACSTRGKGRTGRCRRSLLLAHQDVVPVESPRAWKHAPFGGEVADGAVWGRGAVDCKGSLIGTLEAVDRSSRRVFGPGGRCCSRSGTTRRSAAGGGARAIAALLDGAASGPSSSSTRAGPSPPASSAASTARWRRSGSRRRGT